MGKLDGRCLCGAVTYSSDADPAFAAICHCKNCQTAQLEVTGDTLSSFATVGEDSGRETERQFCSACGSPILSLSAAMPDVAIVKAGTLDDTSWIEPQLEVWGSSAQPWVEPVEGRPRMERGPQG
jgi:hypothetical protein